MWCDDRDVSMQGHCVPWMINFGDQGSQKTRSGTHRFGTSYHHTVSFGAHTLPCQGSGSFARVLAFLATIERPFLEQRIPGGMGKFYSSMLGTAQHLRYHLFVDNN